jgi:signal transduction histidine kinase
MQIALTTRQPLRRRVDGGVVTYRVLETRRGVYVARDEVDDEILHRGVLRSTLIVAGLGVLLLGLAVVAADRLARRVSGPIQEVVRAADAMREGDLDVRVAERGMPEVVTLARALNRLAERVGRLLSAERDAVADLSHRLRTPVTALRLDTEMISDPDVGERLRDHITQLERTVDAIVHDARRPTRSDAVGACDAAKIVRERVEFWSALAEEQGRPLRTAVPDRPLLAKVPAGDLTDVVDVLLDNVFAHTEDGVPIEVWVVPRADGAIVLTVEDGGPGLPAGDIVSRGRSGAGSSGLGLDIARRAAMASGGWLELGQSRLGGALVRVVLGKAGT